jgi:epoxyqueuosine reductase
MNVSNPHQADWDQIEDWAKAQGFDLVRFTTSQLNAAAFSHYESWVTQGRAGEMTYMTREPNHRRSAEALLPGAQSVICLAVNYYRMERPGLQPSKPREETGQVARYAYGRDYHKVIKKMLKGLVQQLSDHYSDHDWRGTVDTAPILERAYAEQSGLGYIGKNANLITKEYGSWVFLAEIVTTKPLATAAPTQTEPTDTCGHCRLCLDICPTGALVGPSELDANKCISYLTIENRGAIPEELRPLIGDWLYGCDLCQEICPKNVRAQATDVEDLQVKRIGGDHQLLQEILEIRTKEAFDEKFAGSAMRRAKREGLVRNACVVAANVKAVALLPLLRRVAEEDESEMVREHAAWAVGVLEAVLCFF